MAIPQILHGRRGAFIAVGAAAILLAFVLGLPMFALFYAQHSDIQESRNEIAAYQVQEAQKPQFEARLRVLQQSAQSVPGLLTGSSAALAQAQLQSGMKNLIESHQGSLLSAQLLPPSSVAGFDIVSISYDLTVPLSRIRELLYAVEAHTPFFFVTDADLIMPANWTPGNPQALDPNMEVHWTVRAYRWNGTR